MMGQLANAKVLLEAKESGREIPSENESDINPEIPKTQ
jgi:hypothetical protein